MPVEVQLISAAWCKRCQVIKPDVERLCTIAEAIFSYIDYDALDESDPVKQAVTALPTIRMRTEIKGEWALYTPTELEAWKTAITATVDLHGETDF